MAADAPKHAAPTTNGSSHPSSSKPIQLAIPLPQSPGSKIHIHLTILSTSLMLFLTSSSLESSHPGAPTSMGSFVYAIPDRYNPAEPLSTPLYTSSSTLDFATRMAKVLARKTGKAAYVGSSVALSGAGAGGGVGEMDGGGYGGLVSGSSVEEEMEAFRLAVRTVVEEVQKRDRD